ncbi:MAG: energy-coupling factor transporter ATPase [Anaerolineae bacterium]|nr:energy-coupling factor transporter ATPase [Anaerolineae bacterium]
MITCERVSFRYPDAAQPALSDVSFTVSEGDFVVVVGPSGAGKSTLLRSLNGLVPHFTGGTFSGRLVVDGFEPVAVGPQRMCRHVGFVFQDPEAQFVMDRVEDEIAFALENAAMAPQEMRSRVEEVLGLLELASLRGRTLATLSGGEKQRVAIAAALALRPRVLVLDEPTSQLDPQSAEDVLTAVARLNVEAGLTIVLAEHRLERVLSFANRVIFVPGGAAPVIAGSPREVVASIALAPPVSKLGKALGWSPLPVTLEEAQPFVAGSLPEILGGVSSGTLTAPIPASDAGHASSATYLVAESLDVAYTGQRVVSDVSLTLSRGEVTVLMGRNGAGKSTLLKSLVGLVRPERGRVRLDGRDITAAPVAEICRDVAYLPQDPNALLFAETVVEELHITLRNHGIALSAAPVPPEVLLGRLGLADKVAAYPRDLSVGERQRVALAAIMVTEPGVLLLDEPTRGLDYEAKARLADLIRQARDARLAVLLVTHDVELAAAVADRVVLMGDGRIVAQGDPYTVLAGSTGFATQIARLFPGAGWLTVEDALKALKP